tara:strand:- start:780 stop:1394 length:615 start_codon:yes stop_codon:yes gene_type:complete
MATTTLSNAFISLNDIINNFLISYTGPGKLIPDAIRTEVIFHARRCLQEFAYETLKSQFSQTTVVPTQTPPPPNGYILDLPQDFVAIISAQNLDISNLPNPLIEVSTSPPGNGEYYIDYANKKIAYANPGNTLGIELTYLSNALTTDESAAIPKLAEEALYSCMVYSILANREKTRPDVLQRLLIEKTDKLEKAKSRLVFTNFD